LTTEEGSRPGAGREQEESRKRAGRSRKEQMRAGEEQERSRREQRGMSGVSVREHGV
jgi:hypothetical protein